MTLEFLLDGPQNPGRTVVFVHGWTGDARVWEPLSSALVARGHRCIRVTLPAFPTSEHQRGADFPELVERLEATVASVVGTEPIVLIGHDWGAVVCYLYATLHRDRIERSVTLDVGGGIRPGVLDGFAFVAYQSWLIGALAIGRLVPPLGNGMSAAFARAAGAPRPSAIHARANYPYFYAWRALLHPRYKRSMVSFFKPTAPHLYLYGAAKPFQFHTEAWLEEVRKLGQVVPIEGAGHWLMVDRPQPVQTAIEGFLGHA